jgi:hypothetical protein
MRLPVSDMTFVLRTCGERTSPAAATHLRALVAAEGGNPAQQVHIVSERPFAKAVRRTFELGLDARRPWVVAIDADVLLLSDGLQRLGNLCAAADGAAFTIAGLILCKFYGGFCFMGIHAYPHRFLDKALTAARDAATTLRPESSIAKVLESQGLKPFAPPVPLAIHDFEQFYRHIYLKMRTRGQRWAADNGAGSDTAFADHLGFVERRSRVDPDYLVASWGLKDGFEDGSKPNAPTHYDWEANYPHYNDRFAAARLSDKQPWPCSALGLAECVMATHDYLGDNRTPRWIRDRFDFSRGPAHALRRIGIDVESLRRPESPPSIVPSREAA